MSTSIFVRNPRQCTTKWAQRVMNGCAQGITVSEAEVLDVDVGTTTRVSLAVTHDGAESVPRRWFVKCPSQSWRARFITAMPRLLINEARFYAEVIGRTELLYPKLLGSQCGRFAATLVLEDVREYGAIPGTTGTAIEPNRVRSLLTELAALHARFWGRNGVANLPPWLDGRLREAEQRLGTLLAVSADESWAGAREHYRVWSIT